MTVPQPDLISVQPNGLFCESGGCFVDPWKPVDKAIITHAHSDHHCRGCGTYLCTPETAAALRVRVGPDIRVQELTYGERVTVGDVHVSLHPAGHILGSAQVRLEPVHGGPVWVITGDYKTVPDRVSGSFESVPCDVFITESTFGLPVYRWPDQTAVAADINAWWQENAEAGRTSLLIAYALGKAQRVIAELDPSIGPIGCHGSVQAMCDVYRNAGAALPPTVHANAESAPSLRGQGIVVAPGSVLETPWVRRFVGPNGIRRAMVSGWMMVRGRRRWRTVDRGFIMSDHADWNGLIETIRATGASRIGVTHGYTSVMSRYLEEQGFESCIVPTRFTGEQPIGAGAKSYDQVPAVDDS
ncbi:MAG: ligase-associated DNA damage response exonuclease [Planctomycetota bacterium]